MPFLAPAATDAAAVAFVGRREPLAPLLPDVVVFVLVDGATSWRPRIDSAKSSGSARFDPRNALIAAARAARLSTPGVVVDVVVVVVAADAERCVLDPDFPEPDVLPDPPTDPVNLRYAPVL